jgi:hypothetical protein
VWLEGPAEIQLMEEEEAAAAEILLQARLEV